VSRGSWHEQIPKDLRIQKERLMITSSLNRRDWLKLAGSAGLANMVLPSQRAAVAAGGRPRQASIANSPYSRQVLSLRPVGYWRLGERNAPTAFDLSGQENNGIYHGTPALGERRDSQQQRFQHRRRRIDRASLVAPRPAQFPG
jgi:hypothetical protein